MKVASSHLGEHTGDLLCCVSMEAAEDTAPALQALVFPLKSYYFLHVAPLLHTKAV